MPSPAGQPLYDLIARIRSPASLREIIASCLRHVYMGDPTAVVPAPRREFMEGVVCAEVSIGGLRCAVYRPRDKEGNALPVMFYMHGGGFVFGCSEDTDYITRRLCLENDLVVISINYPLAPEAVFPLALDSCMQVMREVCRAQTHWNIDSKAVYVAGDSAGANLAAAVALQMKASGMTAAGLLMLAPWLDMHVESYESYNLLAPTGIVYDSPFIGYARAAYVSFSEWKNPLVSPIHCEPAQLPPSLIIIGTDDPFFDQAVSFEKTASKNGCAHIELVPYEGMPHCFYSLPGLFTEEEDCYKRIVPFIRKFVR